MSSMCTVEYQEVTDVYSQATAAECAGHHRGANSGCY